MLDSQMRQKTCPLSPSKETCLGEDCAVAVPISGVFIPERKGKEAYISYQYRYGLINTGFLKEPEIREFDDIGLGVSQ